MIMPYGGNDWLALTQEPTLEPELPICDAHHHFWDRRLQSLPYQRYLLDELHADISSGHNVRSTVFLEARSMYRPDGPVAMRPVGEVEFVQGLAAASASGIYGPSRAAAAIIGHADLKLGANVAPVLDALQAASPNRFRGIRHNVTWSPDPAVDNRESEGILAHATFREGAKVLSQRGLSLDMMISFPQMPEVADFARAVPELPIILNHIGALNRVGLYANREAEVRAVWQAGIAAVAACPNITLKLGGMGICSVSVAGVYHARGCPWMIAGRCGMAWTRWAQRSMGVKRCARMVISGMATSSSCTALNTVNCRRTKRFSASPVSGSSRL
jgi:L-fuconolactonase